jgi:protocatechuate 3,4-dioxygenase, beta subunit
MKRLDRRGFITASLSGAAALLLPAPARAALTPTPRQTEGPFYPLSLPLDADADLVSVAGRAGPAQGTITHVFGRVLDSGGRSISGARVEIWQCDALGRYHHPRDGGGADPNFQGYGAVVTDREGLYRFRTIRPVPYPGRTPHIHFALSGGGFDRFTTQMYVEGEPLNEGDFILSRIRDPAARERVIVRLEPADTVEAGALLGRFDIVVGEAEPGSRNGRR